MGKFAHFEASCGFSYDNMDLFEEISFTVLSDISFLGPKLISRLIDMKKKKNAFSTLVLEFVCQSKFSC
jgi:hypothetical protein